MIRDGTADDVGAVRAVFRRASWSNVGDRALLTLHPEFLDWSDAAAVDDGHLRVAVIAGRVVGFSAVRAGFEAIEIDDLFVDPDWMRRGVARALVTDAVERARQWGARRLEVDANAHALAFYRSAGFITRHTVGLEHGTATRMTLSVDGEPTAP